MKRGFWIWNIPQCEGGDAVTMAGVAKQAGLSDVFVKIADGAGVFNVKNGIDLARPVVSAMRAVGIRVWGWQYSYLAYPKPEAQVAARRVKDLGLDGFVIDAEVEWKKAGAGAALVYLNELKSQLAGVELGLSSFRFPHYHPEFPWTSVLPRVDVNMPQVYWLQAHNAGQQLQICLDKFRAMSRLPIYPTGAAWKENGWRPSPAEIQDFEQVAAENELPLVSYWSWEHCRRDLPELWPAGKSTIDLATIEQKVTALERTMAQISADLADIRTLLKESHND